eukprot:CAMPEP_0119051008 /NCGR_PEP_ID=MMETSP1177-20130426/72763_1 /TAXON_ID=2985 /ORGANISM="Ochromonas sp, Strain CCMP1899" /LENGTH=101 /DNA_ID=CAMNT_0007030055 /DNA_START=585 /DNA_END=890 /DNA_ORIENTATION=+
MTIAAYETLYESSIAYGIRKALMAQQKLIELDSKVRQLSMSKRELTQQAESLRASIDITQSRSLERREAEEKTFAEEVERIQRTNEHLKVSLESMLSAPKK